MFIYCICTQYLVGAPFALITASIRRGMEVISLWHCWGGMEAQVSLTVAFSSSAFFGLLFLIFLLTIPHRFSMGFRSDEFAVQSSTPTPWSFNQLLVLLAVWAGAKSCWKIHQATVISMSPVRLVVAAVSQQYIVIFSVLLRKQDTGLTHSKYLCLMLHCQICKINLSYLLLWLLCIDRQGHIQIS